MNKQQRDRVYSVRLTPDERRKIESAAVEHCTSGGAIVRLAVKKLLKEIEGNGSSLDSTPVTLSQNA